MQYIPGKHKIQSCQKDGFKEKKIYTVFKKKFLRLNGYKIQRFARTKVEACQMQFQGYESMKRPKESGI